MERSAVEILLVEDCEQDIELTLHALRAQNLANNVRIARDGEEALQFIAECTRNYANGDGVLPRLVLLDLKLPKVDGIEVLRRIKSDPATKMIPVVVMTSSVEEKDLVKSYHLGVNSYIQKPLDFEEFRNNVKDLGFYWLLVNRVPGALNSTNNYVSSAKGMQG